MHVLVVEQMNFQDTTGNSSAVHILVWDMPFLVWDVACNNHRPQLFGNSFRDHKTTPTC